MEEEPEDVVSPPYPGQWVTGAALLEQLAKLKAWADEQGPRLNARIGRDIIPAVRKFPPPAAYAAQPVLSQFGHLLFVRRLREQWDHLYRQFESAWNNERCVQQRVLIVQAAVLMLNSAFTPMEHREARGEHGMDHLQRIFENIQHAIERQMEVGTYDPDPEGEGCGHG